MSSTGLARHHDEGRNQEASSEFIRVLISGIISGIISAHQWPPYQCILPRDGRRHLSARRLASVDEHREALLLSLDGLLDLIAHLMRQPISMHSATQHYEVENLAAIKGCNQGVQSRGVIRGAIKRRHQRSSEVEDLAAAHRARVAKAALPRAVGEARGDDRRDRRACLMRGGQSACTFSAMHTQRCTQHAIRLLRSRQKGLPTR